MQDNDPKHTFSRVAHFLQAERVNWWKTPPESPDCNSIENLWHEFKEFIRRVVKPTGKQMLIKGIAQFWETVDVPKCRKYIKHFKKKFFLKLLSLRVVLLATNTSLFTVFVISC